MLGGARKGYCSIESPRITTTPIKSVRIEITIATIGRRIKKLAMDHQLPYISTSIPALLELRARWISTRRIDLTSRSYFLHTFNYHSLSTAETFEHHNVFVSLLADLDR